jgi:hypothetical protein
MPTSPRRGHPDGGPPAPRLYSPAEVARALGCSEWWVKEQARNRRIPFSWIGGSYRFTAGHLLEIVKAFEVRPVPAAPSTSSVDRTPRRRPYRPAAAATRLQARPPRRSRGGPDSSAA